MSGATPDVDDASGAEGLVPRRPEGAEGLVPLVCAVGLLLVGLLVLRVPAIVAYRGVLAVPLVLVAWTSALMVLISPAVLGFVRFESAWSPAASALLLGLAVLWVLCRFWGALTNLRDVAAPAGTTLGAPDSVSVLSWNVYLRCAAAERWHGNDHKERRVPDIARIAADTRADVLCFQEACSALNFRVHRLRRLLARRGYRYSLVPHISPHAAPAQVVDDGLCIFSRLPLRPLRRGRFRAARGPDALMAKGYLVAEVGLEAGEPGRALRVANLHLQSSYRLEPTRQDVATRRAQLAQLLREAGPHVRAENTSCVLAGDLNVNAWANRRTAPPAGGIASTDGRREPEGEYAKTLSTMLAGGLGFRDAHARQSPPPRTQTCAYGASSPHERHTCFYPPRPGDVVAPRTLDYLWHSPDLAAGGCGVVRARGASDHHALVATFSRV